MKAGSTQNNGRTLVNFRSNHAYVRAACTAGHLFRPLRARTCSSTDIKFSSCRVLISFDKNEIS